MPVFYIQTKVTGTAIAQVIAESLEHARDMFNSGAAVMEIEDWDICTDASRGGYLDVSASMRKVADDPYENRQLE